jgi:hypothetical protein
MTRKPVDPAVATVMCDGKAIGFCCPACAAPFSKLTDAEKKTKLEAAMK